jgi:hypothetical protein
MPSLARVCKFSANSLVSNVYHQMCTFFGVGSLWSTMAKGKKGKRSSQPANANGMSRCWHVAVRNALLNSFVLTGGNLLLCALLCHLTFELSSLVSALATRWLANAHTHTPHSLYDELVSHHLSLLSLVGLVWLTCIART